MKNNMPPGLLLALVSISFSVSAHQIKIPMTYEAMPKASFDKVVKASQAGTEACAFTILPTLDKRQNKVTIAFNGDNLEATEVSLWLNTAMQHFTTHTQQASAKAKLQVQPTLTRLYTYHESMNIHGVVSVKLDYVLNDQLVESKQYRGFYAKTNWAGANGEYVTALNDAINNLMPKVVQDLPRVCQAVSSAPAKEISSNT